MKRLAVVLVVVGLVAVVGSFVWRSVAVPRLVKYPTDLDETPRYEGTVTLFLDPTTYAPAEPPIEAPLAVDRNIRVVESSSDLVVVKETITLAAEPVLQGTLEAQYVMDRREAVNVADSRSWAFFPDNPVDRAGAYRLQFPFDTDAVPFTIYKNEVAGTYTAEPRGEGEVEGMSTLEFGADAGAPVPVSEAYLRALDTMTPLPREMTLDQLKPVLKANGIDVDVLLPALLPLLSEEDRNSLLALATEPIGLQYSLSFAGGDSVEPSTGSILQVQDVVETLYVAPEESALPPLVAVLEKYPDVPEAVTALEGLQRLAASPIKVFTNEFSQTPASVADISDSVRDKKDQKALAESTIPTALLVVGLVLVLAAIVLYGLAIGRARRAAAAPVADEPAPVIAGDSEEDPPTG